MMEELYRSQYPPFLKWVLTNRGSVAVAQDAFHDAWLIVKAVLDSRTDIKNPGGYLSWVAKTTYMKDCKHKKRYIPTDFNLTYQYEADSPEIDDDPVAISDEASPDQGAEASDMELIDASDLAQMDELLYDPNNLGIVQTCLDDLTARQKLILTLYFTLQFASGAQPFTQAEISDQIAAHCRELLRSNDTRNSINVDKTRSMDALRTALHKRFPEKVRHLKSVFDKHKAALKKKKGGEKEGIADNPHLEK
jgi:RNA polymerase sigma factor (sigma-70 family)